MPRRPRYRRNTTPTASTNMPWATVLQYGPLAAEFMKYGYDYWRGRGNNQQGNESSEEGNTREEEVRQREKELKQREERMREEMKQREEMMKQKEEMKQKENEMKRREEEMKQREEKMKQREEMKQKEDELKQREEKIKQWEEMKRMEDEMKEKMRQKNTKMRGEINNDLERENKRVTIETAAEKSEQQEQEALIRKEEERERESQAHGEELEKAQKEAQEKAKDEEEIQESVRKNVSSPVGSGQQEPVPPPLPVRLPTVCRQYWSRTGCKKHACDQLHICKLFLAGICKFGARCHNEHSLASNHNKTVCSAWGLFRKPRIIELRELLVEEGLYDHRFYHSQLEICRKQDGTCRNCIRIHICQRYVEGTCTEQQGCRFGHAVKTEHNIRVLHLHKAGNMNDLAILQLLSAKTALRGVRAAQERAYATRRGARSAPRH